MQDTSAAALGSSSTAAIVSPGDGIWVSWLDGPIRFMAMGEQTGQGYCAAVGVLPSRCGPPPHRHSFHEGFYILEGEVTFVAGREQVTLGKGDFINIAGGTVHRLVNESDTPARMLVIAAPAGLDKFQREAGGGIEGPEETGKFTREEIAQRMRVIAPQYGIELDPPASAYDEVPRFTVRRAGEGQSVAVVGDVYRFLVEAEDTDGTYAIWHAVVTPGGGPPPHLHRCEEEGFFVLSGEVAFYADGQRHLGGPGTFAALPRNGLHRFQNEGQTPAEMLILVTPAGLERMFHETGQPWSDRTKPVPPPTQAEIERLLAVAPRYGVELHLEH